MKPVTEQQIADHTRASIRGVVEGAVVSGAVALGGSYYLGRKWATYRALPPSLKALAVVIIVAPCVSIQAERRGLEYDKSQWEGEGMQMLDEKAVVEESRWSRLSTREKIGDWAERHEYSIILGSWALSMAVAGGIISRDRYQTFPQKIVQARMWAQGLTVGVLIAAGALTHAKRQEATKHLTEDHSWRELLEMQERQRQETALAQIAKPGQYKVPL